VSRLPYMLLLAGIAAAADDPGGWTAAKWGMTRDQVRAAIPSAKVLTGPADARTVEKDVSDLGIDAIAIGAIDWTVLFFFDASGGLRQVRLAPVNTKKDATEQQYLATESLLVEKYGRPFDRNATESTDVRDAQWTIGKTTIHLRRLAIRRVAFQAITLIYRRKIDSPL
jgi:hypothetical protein